MEAPSEVPPPAAWIVPMPDAPPPQKLRRSLFKRFRGLLFDSLGDVTLSLLTKYTTVLMSFFAVPADLQNTWSAISIVSLFLLSILSDIENELVTLNDKAAAPLQRKQSFENTFRRGIILMFYRVIFVLTVRTTAAEGLFNTNLFWAAIAVTPVSWALVFGLTQVLLGRAGRAARMAQLAILNLDAFAELLLVVPFYPMFSQKTQAANMFQVSFSCVM
jgi:hypothetical protein